jgi:hypothetical protein
MLRCCFSQFEVILGVAAAHLLCLAARHQPGQRIPTDRLQHREAGFTSALVALDQALIDQRSHSFQHIRPEFGAARSGGPRLGRGSIIAHNGCGSFQRPIAHEHAQPCEARLLVWAEQPIAPVNCVEQRLLAPVGLTYAMGEQRTA